MLITGGTGFVGRRLVEACSAAGRPITAATRFAPSSPMPAVRYVEVGDIGPRTDWREALAGVEAVIHLAAHVHVAPERAEHEGDVFDRVNHLASVRLFEAAQQARISRFVFMSSITVLGGETSPGQPFDDCSPTRPEGPYARSKRAAELALVARAAGGGTSLFVLRPPLICGAGVSGNLGALVKLAGLPIPLPLGAVRNRRTLLSVDNLVSAIQTILDHPEPRCVAGTYLLGDQASLSTTTIVEALRDGLERPRWLVPVPAGVLHAVLAGLGQSGAARRLLGDLEADSTPFRTAFSWSDVVDTRATLVAAGEARRG